MGTGRDLYINRIRPAVITFPKLVNHFSISLLNNPRATRFFPSTITIPNSWTTRKKVRAV